MSRADVRAPNSALICVAFLLAILLLSGCAPQPVPVWPHWVDPWPQAEPDGCPAICTI